MYPPHKIKGAPEDGTPACTSYVFIILLSIQAPPLTHLHFLTQFYDIFRAIQTILGTAVNDTRAKVLICIFLMVATFCVYSQVQDHEFINFDDNRLVTKSSLVQAGLTNENIIRVFTTTHYGGWAPITSISYMLDYQLYGLNPKGFLLTNLFFHIANSLLLFLILFRMTGAIWQSAFVAASVCISTP